MIQKLRLTEQQISDLQVLRDLSVPQLQMLIQHLHRPQCHPLNPQQLRKEICEAVEIESTAADALLRILIFFHTLIGQSMISADELLSEIRINVQQGEKPWKSVELNKWAEVEDSIKQLLLLDAIRVVSKALALSYEHANILYNARILTDVRPLFDLDGASIEGAVVSQTLLLKFNDGTSDKTLSLALDESDVKTLKEQCERALRKAETTSQFLKSSPNIPVIIAGRDV